MRGWLAMEKGLLPGEIRMIGTWNQVEMDEFHAQSWVDPMVEYPVEWSLITPFRALR